MNLALFDFDGTLTLKDSFLEFIKFSKGKIFYWTGLFLLSPILVLFKLGLIKNWRAKELVMRFFFNKMKVNDFENLCNTFAKNVIPTILRPEAYEKLEEHLTNKNKVVIVTASVENWINPWSDQFNIELIGTKLKVKDNLITGEIEGKNCYGPEKVVRLKEKINLADYSEIFVYGDSKGDNELFSLGTKKFYKVFK